MIRDLRLLRVAATLRAPFSAQELTVAAWRAHPETYCLRGFREYPCSRTVTARLCGLRDRGWVENRTQGAWRVTDAGRLAVGLTPQPKRLNTEALLRCSQQLATALERGFADSAELQRLTGYSAREALEVLGDRAAPVRRALEIAALREENRGE